MAISCSYILNFFAGVLQKINLTIFCGRQWERPLTLPTMHAVPWHCAFCSCTQQEGELNLFPTNQSYWTAEKRRLMCTLGFKFCQIFHEAIASPTPASGLSQIGLLYWRFLRYRTNSNSLKMLYLIQVRLCLNMLLLCGIHTLKRILKHLVECNLFRSLQLSKIWQGSSYSEQLCTLNLTTHATLKERWDYLNLC